MQSLPLSLQPHVTAPWLVDSASRPLVLPNDSILQPKPAAPVPWRSFNHVEYLALGALKPGQDRYEANKFNQAASDATSWDRAVPDAREYQYSFPPLQGHSPLQMSESRVEGGRLAPDVDHHHVS